MRTRTLAERTLVSCGRQRVHGRPSGETSHRRARLRPCLLAPTPAPASSYGRRRARGDATRSRPMGSHLTPPSPGGLAVLGSVFHAVSEVGAEGPMGGGRAPARHRRVAPLARMDPHPPFGWVVFRASSPGEAGVRRYAYRRLARSCVPLFVASLTFQTQYIHVVEYRGYVPTRVALRIHGHETRRTRECVLTDAGHVWSRRECPLRLTWGQGRKFFFCRGSI